MKTLMRRCGLVALGAAAATAIGSPLVAFGLACILTGAWLAQKTIRTPGKDPHHGPNP